MIRAFRNLIERQLAKAQAEGPLQEPEGAGKPLPGLSSETHVDAGLAAGLRIMAQAGVVPQEFTLKEQLAEARRNYTGLTVPGQRKAAMARISDLEMRYNMARDARKSFFR
ncbi:DnaJ family domain-containing protein [Leisingera sp. S232]|uniref:DnaJ family domain-containing protein n=1 Tax=Leisingera sp. S232 TaxID=3415132 RepID=UPI003C7D996D